MLFRSLDFHPPAETTKLIVNVDDLHAKNDCKKVVKDTTCNKLK